MTSAASIALPEAPPADYLAWVCFLRRSTREVPEALTDPIRSQAAAAQQTGRPMVSPVVEADSASVAHELAAAAGTLELITLQPWAALAPDLLDLKESVAEALRHGLSAIRPEAPLAQPAPVHRGVVPAPAPEPYPQSA